MAAKPSIPKGTRDFSPVEMAKRNYIFNTIREVYHLYGFQQIETPSMEMLSTLMGKYGEEGDKLLFKIQNSGDYFSGLTDEELQTIDRWYKDMGVQVVSPVMDDECGTQPYFSHYPAFGLPTEVVDCDIL